MLGLREWLVLCCAVDRNYRLSSCITVIASFTVTIMQADYLRNRMFRIELKNKSTTLKVSDSPYLLYPTKLYVVEVFFAFERWRVSIISSIINLCNTVVRTVRCNTASSWRHDVSTTLLKMDSRVALKKTIWNEVKTLIDDIVG